MACGMACGRQVGHAGREQRVQPRYSYSCTVAGVWVTMVHTRWCLVRDLSTMSTHEDASPPSPKFDGTAQPVIGGAKCEVLEQVQYDLRSRTKETHKAFRVAGLGVSR
jgi:hypothetical protein